MARQVVLVGAMGTGKSTIGRPLAEGLGRPFVDNDALLEQRTGLSAAQIEARDGIDALHEHEAAVFLEALTVPEARVIAAAASTIERADVRAALARQAWVVWLHTRPEVLARRQASPIRPFGDRDPAQLIAEQAHTRDALYASVADVSIETGDEPAATSVARVRAAFEAEGFASAPG